MPLVVPGINSTGGDKTEEWQNKLVGKRLSDDEASTETVRFIALFLPNTPSLATADLKPPG
jgi:hypothetical protein